MTPYTPATGKVNGAGRIEVQSVDRTPQVLTIKAKKRRLAKVAVSGRLLAGGRGVSGISVAILAGKKSVGKAVTKAGGYFNALVTAPGTARFSASVAVAPRKTASCSPAFAPLPMLRIVGGRIHGEEHGGEGELGAAQVQTGGRPRRPPSRINPPRPFHTKT